MKIGQKFELFRVDKQPHPHYPEIGKHVVGEIHFNDRITRVPAMEHSDDYYWWPSKEITAIGSFTITKLACHICGNKTDLFCQKCDEPFCENCQAPYNQFSQIDYDCCEQCYNAHRLID